MARDDEREAVVRADRPGGALGVRVPGERRKLAVADDLAPRNVAQGLDDGALKRGVASRSILTSANESRAPVKYERSLAASSFEGSSQPSVAIPEGSSCQSSVSPSSQSSPTPQPSTS